MNNSLKEKIILPSWELIRDDANIKKYYLLPGLLSIVFLTALLAYQAIYTYVKIIGNNQDKVLKAILRFLETSHGIELIVVSVIFLGLYFLLMPVFEAGLIKYLHYKSQGKTLSKSEAFGQGIHKFPQIFEYNNIFSEFKLLSLLNFYLFSIRFVGLEYFSLISYIFLALIIPSLLINILFSYSKYFIIIEHKSVFSSIGASTKLAIFNMKKTIKIFFLLFFLNFRVVINFFIFLFFPIIIVSALLFITSQFLKIIAIIVLGVIFLGLILLMGYITTVLEIFKTALWYYAYLDGKELVDEEEEK